jgi:transcriptional regulator with XRE-family HTH domain
MISGESPAVARRRVRLALRDARRRKSLTQGQVAKALEWSLSKVQRIEAGEVSVSTTDLRALLTFYGIQDPRRIEELTEAARISRRQRWWTAPEYREHLTPAMMQLLQFESEASAIRMYQPMVIPGIFQSKGYADWVLSMWSGDLSESDRKVRLEARLQRRQQVLDQPDPPDFLLILDESVLYRALGGLQIMADQLYELLELMRRPNIYVRVVPFAESAVIGMLGPFTVLDLGDEQDAILYRESLLQDEVAHAAHQVRRHRDVFEQLWARSFDEPASARLIEAKAAAMRSELDRQDLA